MVEIFIPKRSGVAKDGFLGSYFLKKALRRGHFSFFERKDPDPALDSVIEVRKGDHPKAWDLMKFFTAENSDSLTEKFDVIVRVNGLVYLP